MTLAEADNAVTFSAGAGSWTVSDPDDQHRGNHPGRGQRWLDGPC